MAFISGDNLRVLSLLVMDPTILRQHRHLLSPGIWGFEAHEEITEAILYLYDCMKKVPEKGVLAEYLHTKYSEQPVKRDRLVELAEGLYEHDPLEVGAIYGASFKETLRFHSIKTATNKVSDILQASEQRKAFTDDDFQKVQKLQAQSTATKAFVEPYDYFSDENIENRTDVNTPLYGRDNLIATGYSTFDNFMKGGAGAGELWAIAGKPNRGKSRFMQNLAAKALLAGKKVVIFTLEMPTTAYTVKIDQILLGTTVEGCKGVPITNTLKQMRDILSSKGARLTVFKLQERTYTMQDIEAIVPTAGFMPDLLITDYLDLILPPGKSSGNPWIDQDNLFIEGRRVAGVLGCVHWTVLQPKAIPDETVTITGELLGGSYGKMKTLDGGWSINCTEEDMRRGAFTSYCFKNRYGINSIYVPMYVDAQIGRIFEQKDLQQNRQGE